MGYLRSWMGVVKISLDQSRLLCMDLDNICDGDEARKTLYQSVLVEVADMAEVRNGNCFLIGV